MTLPASHPAVKVKKPIQTKFRMPVFNWVALKPSQIDGTVFTELNDEKVLQVRPCGHLGGECRGLGGAGACAHAAPVLTLPQLSLHPHPHCTPAGLAPLPTLHPSVLSLAHVAAALEELEASAVQRDNTGSVGRGALPSSSHPIPVPLLHPQPLLFQPCLLPHLHSLPPSLPLPSPCPLISPSLPCPCLVFIPFPILSPQLVLSSSLHLHPLSPLSCPNPLAPSSSQPSCTSSQPCPQPCPPHRSWT